jgi:hypothetical protein
MKSKDLRVTLDAKQVRQACEEYVEGRTLFGAFIFEAKYDGAPVVVNVTKKRERKAKAPAAAIKVVA